MSDHHNQTQYESLLRSGLPEQAAARIAGISKRGTGLVPYEDYTKSQLYELSQILNIQGRSKMDKPELLGEIRKAG